MPFFHCDSGGMASQPFDFGKSDARVGALQFLYEIARCLLSIIALRGYLYDCHWHIRSLDQRLQPLRSTFDLCLPPLTSLSSHRDDPVV